MENCRLVICILPYSPFSLDKNHMRYHVGKLQVSNMHFTMLTILIGIKLVVFTFDTCIPFL